MDNAELLDALQSDLIAAGIGRKPGDVGPAGDAPYPVYLEPRDGVPKPGDKSGNEANSLAVLGLRVGGGFAPGPWESSWLLPTVDLIYRVNEASLAYELDREVDELWTDKRQRVFGTGPAARTIIESLRWRAIGPVTHSRDHGFEYLGSWQFQTYRDN